ncbi:MAG: hypothetical protein QME42_06120 [bacterium]|nr:hypothetical protein [bacterium]
MIKVLYQTLIMEFRILFTFFSSSFCFLICSLKTDDNLHQREIFYNPGLAPNNA